MGNNSNNIGIALAAGLLIHTIAPGALSNWFNTFMQNILNAVPTG
ncbi:hypothetical protein [Desulfosporosinus sp. I2]|nr:hypothetical protein [Desulfosporosinus sp. I2]